MALCSSEKPRALLCPFPGNGHTNPMLSLASKLLDRGFSVSLLLEDTLASVDYGFSMEALDVKLLSSAPGSPELKAISSGVRKLSVLEGNDSLQSAMQSFRKKLPEVVASETWELLIADVTFSCLFISALKLPVHWFSPYSAASILVYFEHSSTMKNGVVEGLPPFHARDKLESLDFSGYLNLKPDDILIFNTSEYLEASPLKALRERHLPRARTAGLLLITRPAEDANGNAEGWRTWLDAQLPDSVIYICFGSWICLTDLQLQELAFGLEQSKLPFLLVLPTSASLPDGFESRVQSHGFILKGWAPQQRILQHPSVAACLNVCGWNSILECMTLAGVPMAAWPIVSDQLVNCRYLVDGLKLGVEVFGDQERDGLVTRDEVQRIVKLLLGPDPEILDMRSRAKSLKARLQEEEKAPLTFTTCPAATS